MDTSEREAAASVSTCETCKAATWEIFLVFILATSVIGLLTALTGHFIAEIVLCVSLLSTLIYCRLYPRFGSSGSARVRDLNRFHILAILMVALIFRLTPFHHVFGGQDQGVYVNIASVIERTGSIQAKDAVIDLFAGDHYQRYLQDNYAPGYYLPGVYRFRGEDGRERIQFQFYHLFPIWMALFEGIFGAKGGVYALTFLSLLSLLFCYKLVELLTDEPRCGFAAALLLAVNPLHSFFSKWPVTEAPTLMFGLAGYLCLLAYYRTSKQDPLRAKRLLILSAFSFGCLFFTRISGFIYLPLLFSIYAAAVFARRPDGFSRDIAVWFFGVVGLYALSVWYGIAYSYFYSRDIYSMSFSRIFGDRWLEGIAMISAVFMTGSVAIYVLRTRSIACKAADFLARKRDILMGFGFMAVGLGAAYRIYALGFTDRYASDAWIQGMWKLANQGWESVMASSLVVTAVAVTPFVIVPFIYFMLSGSRSGIFDLVKIAVLTIFAYLGIMQFFIPYQPYYDRYLLSEFVPYIVISVVVAWSAMPSGFLKKAFSCCLVIGGIMACSLSLLHVGKEEQRGAFDDLHRIVKDVGDRDAILLNAGDMVAQIKTPLVYKFGKNVISIGNESIKNTSYMNFILHNFDNVFLLSAEETVRRDDWIPCGTRRVTYESFNKSRLPAHAATQRTYAMEFYRFDKSRQRPGIIAYGQALTQLPAMVGKVEGSAKVTDATRGFLVFGPYRRLSAGEYRLTVFGRAKRATSAWVDVVSDRGRVLHARSGLRPDVERNLLLPGLHVALDGESRDVEIRIFVGAEDDLALTGYEFVPASGPDGADPVSKNSNEREGKRQQQS